MTPQIYFIQRADGLIKIGYSSNFDNRLAQLKKSHEGLVVLKVINGDRQKERETHYQFEAAHEYGEWFRPEQWVLDAIASITDGAAITFRKTPSQIAWGDHEKQIAEEAFADAKKLYALFYRPTLDNQESTVARICEAHGLPPWPFKHLLSGRCNLPTAALVNRVRKAIRAEHEARIASLNVELEVLRAAEEPDPLVGMLDKIELMRGRLHEVRSRLQ